MNRQLRALAAASAAALLAACATVGGGPGGTVTNGGGTPTNQNVGRPDVIWPIKVREHVDLWLHGFAMLQEDTTFVPFFKRGYGTDMTVLKNRANVVTQLDANRDRLRARLAVNPQLINAQFVPLNFSSWSELAQTVDLFIRSNGDPRAASSQQQANAIAFLAAYFQTGPDRDWLRLFVQSLTDESNRFYHSYWQQQQRERGNVLELADTLWQRTYRPRMQRFFSNTQQAQGDILLSLPLDGEGRTQTNGTRSNTIPFLSAAVRGGALLIQRTSPEILDGYMRYYLRSVNRPVGSNLQTTFTSTFAIPDTIRDAIARQLDVVLGGI